MNPRERRLTYYRSGRLALVAEGSPLPLPRKDSGADRAGLFMVRILAPNLGQLIVARGIHGTGGGRCLSAMALRSSG